MRWEIFTQHIGLQCYSDFCNTFCRFFFEVETLRIKINAAYYCIMCHYLPRQINHSHWVKMELSVGESVACGMLMVVSFLCKNLFGLLTKLFAPKLRLKGQGHVNWSNGSYRAEKLKPDYKWCGFLQRGETPCEMCECAFL